MRWLGIAKLEEMKMMSRGNPAKIAEYVREKTVYDSLVKTYFNEDNPFVDSPSEEYVNELKEKADSGDEADKIRYAIIKDRYDYYEYKRRDEHLDNVKTRQELRRKLDEGAEFTKSDLLLAEKLARKFPSPDNLVLYATVKRLADQN
jgi:rRNA maturation endonuclease Nob1